MFRMIHTEYYQMQSKMFLLKCYVLQALVYSLLCFLARQIYYPFCALGCHLHLTRHSGLCGYFHWKVPGSCIHQNIFILWFTVACGKGVVLRFPLALTPYLGCSPFLFSFSLCQIGVPLQDTSVIELAKRLLLTKSRCTSKCSSERIFLLP